MLVPGLLPPHLDSPSASLASWIRPIKCSVWFNLNESSFSCLWNTQFHIPSSDCLYLLLLLGYRRFLGQKSDYSNREDLCLVIPPPIQEKHLQSLVAHIPPLKYYSENLLSSQVLPPHIVDSMFQRGLLSIDLAVKAYRLVCLHRLSLKSWFLIRPPRIIDILWYPKEACAFCLVILVVLQEALNCLFGKNILIIYLFLEDIL